MKTKHSSDLESPLPIYIGLNIHHMLGARNSLNNFITWEFVFYNRVLEIESMIASAEFEQYEEEGVVAPACLTEIASTFHMVIMDMINYSKFRNY